jgi:hypothetical protein
MSNPTAAAIRAVIGLFNHGNGTPGAERNLRDFPDYVQKRFLEQAAIIDRETALPELIEALKYARAEISGIYDLAKRGQINMEVSIGQFARLSLIDAALAKAEGTK